MNNVIAEQHGITSTQRIAFALGRAEHTRLLAEARTARREQRRAEAPAPVPAPAGTRSRGWVGRLRLRPHTAA